MLNKLTLLGLGAGLMYYMDPDKGRRRRALVRDQWAHTLHEVDCAIGKASRDLRHRASGTMAGAGMMFAEDHASDDVIVARVRSAMGRVVSHPRAVDVTSRGGRVTLSGPILADEVPTLLSTVAGVRGVGSVEDRLEIHEEAGNVPALQGGRPRPGTRPELLQANWSPAARALVGAAGGWMLLSGLRRGGLVGLLGGAVGTGLLARAATNVPVRELLGAGAGEGEGHLPFEARDSIEINAPVEDVFAFLTSYENYPHFLPNVKQATRLGEGRILWTLLGPGGATMDVEDVITEYAPPRRISWHGSGAAGLRYAGSCHFEPAGEGGTAVHSWMAYAPPGGALGHGAAWMLGYDPKHQLQQILMRAKSYLETGKVPHDAYDPSPPPAVRSGA